MNKTSRKRKEITKRFRRYCKCCGELFVPTSKENKTCENCQKENRKKYWEKKRNDKKIYFF
jgi:uncharacterized OB-fold protein